MRGWRYLVLATSLAGLAGFFAPVIQVRAPDGTLAGASAYDIALGHVDVSPLMLQAEALGLVTHAQAVATTRILEQGVLAYRGMMVACYAPAGLLVLLGLAAFATRRMGRLAGGAAMVLGAACVGVWVLLFREPSPDHATGELGLGLYLLLAAGAGGLVGGLGCVIAPDRGGAR